MKIAGSAMVFVSGSHREEMGLTLEEKTQTRTIRQSLSRLPDAQGLPQLVVDRVSISQDRTIEYQSQYSFSLAGRSSVMTEVTGESIFHELKSSLERLAGGVMDKAVIIKNIREKKDIDIPEAKEAPFSDSTGNPEIRSGNTSTAAWELSVKRTELHFEEESVNFQSSGEVTTEDGRIIRFSLDMSLDRAYFSRTEEETLVQRWQERISLTDPLIISLDGKMPQLTDTGFEFDLNADGKTENISFVSPGSGFLAFDKNGDHIINNGSELFGPGTGNGFMELRAFDEDQNNWIDENDAVFSQLSVWTKDEKGKDLLISLKDAGIGAVSLQAAAAGFDMTTAGNELQGRLKNTGIFLFENGKIGSIQEMDLASRPLDKPEPGKEEFPLPGTVLPTRPGSGVLNSPSTTAPAPEQGGETRNPLKDLLDRIKKLKEEMGRLYEKMSPDSNRRKPGRSGYGYYEALNQETSLFLFDRKGPIRSQSRRA